MNQMRVVHRRDHYRETRQIVQEKFSVNVINNCKIVGIDTVSELKQAAVAPTPFFLHIFGKESRKEIWLKLFNQTPPGIYQTKEQFITKPLKIVYKKTA